MKTIDYYRRYNEKHREQINANSRARYAAQKGRGFTIRPDVAKERREAFAAAIEDADPDIRNELDAMLSAMIALFMANGLKQIAAEHQAMEFIAACVWKGVHAPRCRKAGA